MEREKAVLQMLNHPNIVKLIKLLDDPNSGYCYMVIEYVSGGELFDYIVSHGRLREKDARKFIRQVRSMRCSTMDLDLVMYMRACGRKLLRYY